MDLFSTRPLLLDGAIGTMLQNAGLKAGVSPDTWNLDNPAQVEALHRAYLAAGTQVILTNTFGCNSERHRHDGYDPAALARAGAEIAVRVKAAWESPCLVAYDVGPLGVFLEPLGDMEEAEAEEIFAAPIRVVNETGVDCFIVETMCDATEAAAAVRAAKRFGGGRPVLCTLSFDARGRLMSGSDIPSVVDALTEAGADAIGCNCGVGPDALLPLLPQFTACTSLPLIMKPNAGLPALRDGKTCYDVSPADFAKDMRRLFDAGAWALGGCCGTTPAHIRAMAEALK